MTRRTLKAFLVDIDGTLIDSNDAHARCWVAALDQFGLRVPFDAVRPEIGKGGDKLLRELVGIDDESEQGKAINGARRELFLGSYLPHLHATRGARLLLETLAELNIRVVVATSASADETGKLLAQAGLDDLVDGAVSSSDADSSKPDPDIIAAALQRESLRAQDVLMLGDTPYDIEAAQAAGVRTIALRCGGWWNDDQLGKAVAIYHDPQALAADIGKSPLFRA